MTRTPQAAVNNTLSFAKTLSEAPRLDTIPVTRRNPVRGMLTQIERCRRQLELRATWGYVVACRPILSQGSHIRPIEPHAASGGLGPACRLWHAGRQQEEITGALGV